MSSSPSPRLGYGQNFGTPDRRVVSDDVVVTLMRPDPVLEVELHTHDTAHLILHLRGDYRSSAMGAPTVCRQPMLVYNPPGTTHRDHYARSDRVVTGRFLSIQLSARLWDSVAGTHQLAVDAECRCDPRSLAVAGQLVSIVREDCPMEVEVDALVLELLARHAAPTSLPRLSPHVPPWFERALELLRDRWSEAVSISDVARACDVHPVYLARVFRKRLGQTPGDVIREARVQHASDLLTTTTNTLSEVALMCGFADQSHLTTAFRRSCAMTPGRYRRLFSGPYDFDGGRTID